MILESEDNYLRNKILNAIVENPEIIVMLKEKYVDEELWKFCIEREPSLFKKMKHPTEAICMYACEVDGANLRWVKNKFSYIAITPGMAYTAVKSNPKAILWVPKRLLNYALMEMAFDRDPSLMDHFDDIRPEYLKKLLKNQPQAIQYVKNPDENLICDAIIDSPNICVYLNHITDKMLHTLETYHPGYYALYWKSSSDYNESLKDKLL